MSDMNKRTWLANVREMQKRAQGLFRDREAASSTVVSPQESNEIDTYAILTADMNAGTREPTKARFEELFVAGTEWTEERVREALAKNGIDTMVLEADCDPRGSLRALSRRDAEWIDQDMRHKTQGWELACAWEDDHGDVTLRYVRPMIPGVAVKEISHD